MGVVGSTAWRSELSEINNTMITVGKYTFQDPVPLGTGYTFAGAGIYAILRRDPNAFIVVYIGQSKKVAERVDSNHHKWGCFVSHRATHVAFYPMPRSSEKERLVVEGELIDQFNPPCNG